MWSICRYKNLFFKRTIHETHLNDKQCKYCKAYNAIKVNRSTLLLKNYMPTPHVFFLQLKCQPENQVWSSSSVISKGSIVKKCISFLNSFAHIFKCLRTKYVHSSRKLLYVRVIINHKQIHIICIHVA